MEWIRKYWKHDLAFTMAALFVFLVFINIARLRPVIAPLRPTFVVGWMAFVLLSLRTLKRQDARPFDLMGACMLGVVLSAYLSAFAAPKAPDKALQAANSLWKFLAAYFIVYSAINSRESLRTMFGVLIVAMLGLVYFALKVMILTGGRLTLYVGPFFGVNETALGMSMFLPFCLVLATLPAGQFRLNRVFLATALLCIAIIVRTFSRGGFLAMLSGLFVWLIRANRKGLALILVIAGLIFLAAMARFATIPLESGSQTYMARLQEILKARAASERDPSIQGRIDCAREAITLWKRHPLLGIGVGCFGEHTQWRPYLDAREAGRAVGAAVHNTFLHVLLEHGLLGFSFYLTFLVLMWVRLRSTGNWFRDDTILSAMLRASAISLFPFLVGALFLSEPFNWFYVVLAGIVGGAHKLMGVEENRVRLARLSAGASEN